MTALRVMVALLVLLSAGQVWAQPAPPDRWHPYRGGTNCVQVVDKDGNFNCSPLVTINPATGALSLSGAVSATVQQFFGGVYLGPSGQSAQVLDRADLVLATTLSTTAPSGPLIRGVTLRVRPSPVIPGYCRVVVAGGNGFGEFPLLVGGVNILNTLGFAVTQNATNGTVDYGVTDFPGGPLGC